MPRVSVVLPNYNYARYLGERIRSILDQTYADFELLVIDDASSDDSVAVIERFRDPRIRFVRREVNSGKVYASWNEGLTYCNGELVLFAGADDYAERRMIERLVEPMLENPRIGLAHCKFFMIDGSGAILDTQFALPPQCAFIRADLENDYVAAPRREWQRLLMTNFIWNASGVVMRREALERAGGFDDSLRIAADWRLYMDIAREWSVHYIAEPLNGFRQLEKSVSKRLTGATLMDEIYACLWSQRPYLETDDDRAYAALGVQIADNSLETYIIQNVQNAAHRNDAEIAGLLSVMQKYQRHLEHVTLQ